MTDLTGNQYADTKLMRALQRAERAGKTILQHNCAPIGCSICKIVQLEAEVERLKQDGYEPCEDYWNSIIRQRDEAKAEAERLRAENHRSIGNEIWLAERRLADEPAEALIWASGSAGFGPGGIAEEGWKRVREGVLARWEAARHVS